jgi:GTP-binding protein
MSMTFAPNNSPIAGKEGTQHTFAAIKRRIEKEMETNVSLSYKQQAKKESIEVFGRGELHLGILIENMRREGFELSISPPEIVFRYTEKNEKLEPLEDVTIDVDEKYSGRVIDIMSKRTVRKSSILISGFCFFVVCSIAKGRVCGYEDCGRKNENYFHVSVANLDWSSQ